MKKMLIICAVLLFTAGNVLAQPYYVATTGNDGNDGSFSNPWLTIQHAIDKANPTGGDVINVAAGKYPEQLLITKALTINGADGAILDGTTLGLKIVGVKIKSGDVTFNNVDLAHFSGNGIIVGYEASIPGSLKNVHITNCKISGIQPGYSHGFGIYVGYESEAFKYLPPKLTTHLDYSGLLIENNEITDSKSSSVVLQSITGVSSTLVVRSNYIHDNDNDGIWIDCARNIVIEDNIVAGNVDGVYISSYGDAYIAGSNWEYDWTPHLNGDYGPMNIQITGNQIIDNISYGGIYLESGYPATIFINGNTITGNAPAGLANYLAEEVNATCNWWGSVNGPSGNAVLGDVMFSPWLVTSDLDGSCIGTPLGNKIGVLDDLADLTPSSDKKTDKILEKAIRHLEKSLAEELWEGNDYLSSKGIKVFEEEKKAVHELMKISDLEDVSDAILTLVETDRMLAQTAIDEAVNEKDKAKAKEEMDKALYEIGKGNYDKAIERYKQAWHQATKALKNLAKSYANSDIEDGSELVDSAIPKVFGLGENYPNPFNPTTLISYNLPEASQVSMTVYDMMGRQVKSLIQEFQPAGNHSVIWNATNDNGDLMSGGMYFYQIKAGSFLQTHKMILLK